MNSTSAVEEKFEKRIAGLREKFLVTMIERHSRMRDALADMKMDVITKSEADDLRYDIHKTAGTAGTFGFFNLSSLAATACDRIERLHADEVTPTEAKAAINEFFAELEVVLQKSTSYEV